MRAAAAKSHKHYQEPGRAAMELRLFGSTKRFVARIGQGTWFIEDADRDIAIAALRRGLDLGMTHIDTAEHLRRRSSRRAGGRGARRAAQ